MPRHVASDDELMQAAARGDETAFSELMQRHRSWVRSLVRAFVRDDDQADDVTQEVFCRVHHHASSYDGQGRFTAWLKRIAVNLAKDFLRKQRQTNTVSLEELEETSLEDNRFDPTAALASEALHKDLRTAIQVLPDEQRLVLVMHYFGDMSLQDIAWAMKCPVGTVKSRLFNGLRRVRKTLTEKWEKEEGGENQ